MPEDREEIDFPGLDDRQLGNLLLLAVAICHQTSPRDGPALAGTVAGRPLRGWDFLIGKLAEQAPADRRWSEPGCWSALAGNDLRKLFGESLSQPDERAALIRDLGEVMRRESWSGVGDLMCASGGWIEGNSGGSSGLLGLLHGFRAYDDPVHKKSYYFLALMRNTGTWSYRDPEKLGAPVDYHEVRGHLRIGTVEIVDDALLRKVRRGESVDAGEDIAIRAAVHEAILLLSNETGIRSPSKLHYLFWNVFRGCCTRASPHCSSCPGEHLPQRYEEMRRTLDTTLRCPFASVCGSVRARERLPEHVFVTDYY